ncbi:alpha-N-arabinofuranosidase [Anaerocolumna cellulosilytica]|uniref:non-reducing end alpha-L-arabinofuranosidase n=1 Tax=Anaerocolumna cellulosilytica TaxID=433286 RepID=A0A6S6R4F3_9FIRM|nr:alpha-L-arabinofuranosidase C-terminal domain-containing protein [Anaerocolumna cellulosilytica]MBB5193857.1 alpha-L-arabinofuranosidase [Anaerocolumna cellulosilytica]BCJ94927.1 alpha-N-arabinofuranosidase [Anaerocolumna cellulosilytica]
MKLIVDTKIKKDALGDLFGIFFEDLNHAADGGLYAEMVRNRSFEFAPIDNAAYHPLTAWEKIQTNGEARLLIETGNPVSHKNPHYLAMDVLVPGADVGVQNLGYNTGMVFEEGAIYYFTCYAKREQCFKEPLTISLRNKEGIIYTSQEIYLDEDWKKYEVEITSPVTDNSGRLALTISGRGKVYLDFVSLFPKDTYKGRRNGLRKDIATKLEELKPKFMRFPGGCLVHDGSLDPAARDAMYRWKNTIGPLEERPARRSNWGYNQTLGLGYYEYFQFCEDIGAKPIPVLPGGWDPHHRRAVELDRLQPWIDDALDLIEFANGDSNTVWGKKRAELGHEAPFGLEYIAIGNEEVGEEFFIRYVYFHKAIRQKYPNIKIINSGSPFPAGGEYERGWKSAKENGSDLVDEHYYCSPEWFIANHHRYDAFLKEDPNVFLGEYASWGNTYYNALAEATYMIGLERNAHAVALACYAPMLCNADYVNWRPDMIWYNNHQVFGTANYYVQKLFMNHQGDRLLAIKAEKEPEAVLVTETPDSIFGDIILATNDSEAEYSEISVVNDDTGEVKYFDDRRVKKGELAYITRVLWKNYTVKLKAKETEGVKGFNLYFGHQPKGDKPFANSLSGNEFQWEIGGWQNQDVVLCERNNGRGSCLSQCMFTVERDRVYQLELKVRERFIKTFIDGNEYHAIESKPVMVKPLYYSSSIDESTGEVIIKAVNIQKVDCEAEIKILHAEVMEGKVFTLENYPLEGENSFERPDWIKPVQKELRIENSGFSYVFKSNSMTVFRLH